MKLTIPFTIINNSLNDVWKMHDFNYQLPKDPTKEYWYEECILHPTNSHCKIFDEQLKKIIIQSIKKPLKVAFLVLLMEPSLYKLFLYK